MTKKKGKKLEENISKKMERSRKRYQSDIF